MEKDFQFLIYLIDEIRIAKGITQEDVALKSGYLRSNVNRVFSGKYTPRLDVLKNIASAVGLELAIRDLDGTIDMAKMLEKAKDRLEHGKTSGHAS